MGNDNIIQKTRRKHVQTPKEKCFEEATNQLQKARKLKGQATPEISHQEQWTKDRVTGEWRHEPPAFPRKVKEWFEDTFGMDDDWETGQRRYPDVTVNLGKCKVVVDLKFDRPSGGRDSWGTTPGKYSGQDQRADFNDMNEQCLKKKNLDLSLDADVCECKKKKDDDEREWAEDPAMLPIYPWARPQLRPKAPGARAPGPQPPAEPPSIPEGIPESIPPEIAPETIPPEMIPPEMIPPEIPIGELPLW